MRLIVLVQQLLSPRDLSKGRANSVQCVARYRPEPLLALLRSNIPYDRVGRERQYTRERCREGCEGTAGCREVRVPLFSDRLCPWQEPQFDMAVRPLFGTRKHLACVQARGCVRI